MMKYSFSLLSLLAIVAVCLPGSAGAQVDRSHFSQVFDSEKPYRIFLPDNYHTTEKDYAVIYYFHGNKGTHEFDLEGVASLVKESDIILVAWNGRSKPSDVRPYNIGFHSNVNYQVQFKDYFLELVGHIDSTYRTINDRSGRAVIGHSMGGIMAFFLAGKYPHMIRTAVNSKGSPEFFIGYPENHTLYPVRHLMKNLHGVRLRFHNGTGCELRYLNDEVHAGAIHEAGLDYEYRMYEGEHRLTADQFKDAFEFTVASFKDPIDTPTRWHHADLYRNFDVWGYEVNSTLDEPGFVDLKGVTKGGLRVSTRKWLPEGKPVRGVEVSVKTSARYKPDTEYTLLDFNETQQTKNVTTVRSDGSGRISVSVNHEPHQIGIFRKNDPAELVFVGHSFNDSGAFLDHDREGNLKIRLLNRGGSKARKIKVSLHSTTEGVTIANPELEMSELESGDVAWLTNSFRVTAANKPTSDGSPFMVRFNLVITDGKGNQWNDEFDAPVFYNVPVFTEVGIDDGDSEIFGNGNGNNIAEPGESIMVYQESHRTRLYYDDPYVEDERLHVDLQPDKWGDGYAVSSVIHIAEDCPIGHQIKILACYEVKEWKTIRRKVYWGTFTLTVGKPGE